MDSIHQPIFGLYIHPLEDGSTSDFKRWEILRDSDHLLRRFGEIELIRYEADSQESPVLHQTSDEILALVEGALELHLQDHRPDSPTHRARTTILFSTPSLFLIPSGVAFALRTKETPALVIRIATHERDADSDDRMLDWEEM